MTNRTKLLNVATILLLTSTSSIAYAADTPAPTSETVSVMIDAYMNAFPEISKKEAASRLSDSRKKEIRKVLNCVRKSDGFAGLEIRHSPTYSVVVKYNSDERNKLAKCTNSDVFQAVRAPLSFVELDDAKAQIFTALLENKIEFDHENSARLNRHIIRVKAKDKAKAQTVLTSLDIPKRAVKLKSTKNIGINKTSDIQGQQTVTMRDSPFTFTETCTSGFNVMHTNGTKGVTTAGHCEDHVIKVNGKSHSLQGENDPFINPTAVNNTDLQWMTKSGEAYDPEMSITNVVPNNFLAVYYTTPTAQQPIGTFVCALGRVTNALQCGTTTLDFTGTIFINGVPRTVTFPKAVQPPAQATGQFSFVDEGDSGGPVFDFRVAGSDLGADAYGTITGVQAGVNGTMLYTGIENMSVLGLSVLLEPISGGDICLEFPFLC